MSVRYNRLERPKKPHFHWKQRLRISSNVKELMDWCRIEGYHCYVSFGKDHIPEVLIQKVK